MQNLGEAKIHGGMSMSFVIAYDLGTTGNKATLFSFDGKLIASDFYPYETFYPTSGWVEQDPEQWWNSVKITTRRLLEKSSVSGGDIKAISFSGQMMGIVPVDRNGQILRRSIIWADQRSVEEAKRLEEELGSKRVYSITGTRVTPTYAGPKIAWVKNNEPEIYKETYKFLFAKDYIIFKLTGEIGTDYSDASMSLIFDIKNKEWSDEILQVLDIDKDKLPKPTSSLEVVGNISPSVAEDIGLSKKTLVIRGAGDGAAATIGAGVFDTNEAYLYLGTSSWISTCSSEPFFDPKMRTFNFSHPLPDLYCPTGTMQTGGGSYQWIKDNLYKCEDKLSRFLNLDTYAILDDFLDNTKPTARGLIFLPYLLGERSPHWNPYAKGAFVGLTMIHKREDMLRAVLEGVTFNLKIILEVFENEGHFKFEKIRLIGGGANGRNWRQIIADIFNKTVVVPEYPTESTSIGAAIISLLGIKAVDIDQAKNLVKDVITVYPREKYHYEYEKMYDIFLKTYNSLLEIFNELDGIQKNLINI